jgi:release factor glutamine methyltransferase
MPSKTHITDRSWTIKALIEWASAYFQSCSKQPRYDAELLLSYLLSIPRLELYVNFEQVLTKRELAKFKGWVKERKEGTPIQYIVGFCNFFGYEFNVSDKVLIPRMDTETLVDSVKSYLDGCDRKTCYVIDLGTGSGNIAITLKKMVSDLSVFGIDISEDALAIARDNAKRLDTDVMFLKGNFFDGFDMNLLTDRIEQLIIVSNPPYIETSVIASLDDEIKSNEPALALDGGEDGLDAYRTILSQLQCCKIPLTVFFEHGYLQAKKLTTLFEGYAYENIDMIKDLSGNARVTLAKKP